jgi:hypothetical protein
MLAIDGPASADALSSWVRLVARMQGIELPRTDEEAIAVLEAMTKRDPGFAPTLYFLAISYTRANRPEDVTRTLERLEAVKRAASGAG